VPIKCLLHYVVAIHEIGHIIAGTRYWLNKNTWKIACHTLLDIPTLFELETEIRAWKAAKKVTKWWNLEVERIAAKQMRGYIRAWEEAWDSKMSDRKVEHFIAL
jgi:hypothetical protein